MKKIINEFLFKFLSKCYFKQIKTYLINKKKTTTTNDYKFSKKKTVGKPLLLKKLNTTNI